MNLKQTQVTHTKRKRRLKFGIKQKLLIYFLLVAIIPIVGITIYSTISLQNSYTIDRLTQLEAVGINKADAMESWFEERKGDTDLMSETPTVITWALQAGTYSHPNKTYAISQIESLFLSMMEIYGTYKEMLLLNTTGHVVARTNLAGYAYAHSYGEDVSLKVYYTYPWAQRATEGYTFLSDIEWDDMVVKNYVAVTTAAVIHDAGGTLLGIIVFYIDDAYINGLMHNTVGLGESGETYLTDFNGYWLTTSKFTYYVDEGKYDTLEETIMTELLLTAGIQQALTDEADVQKSSNADYRGIAVMGSYHYLMINSEGLPWILVAEIDVSEALKVVNDLTTISIWIVVIIAVAVAIIGFIIAKRFTDPIIRLNAVAIKVADGDLTITKGNGKVRKGNDEIAVLTRSFGTMTNNIREIISSSQQASINVANIATELAASSSEVNAAAEEISSTTQEVSQNTQSQVNSLVDINKMANEIQALSHEVMASTKDINKIMDLITGISDQTNLLALNASIEAGRAGEHGRGFAVVADEVRKLAEESQNAVRETGDKMESITERITNTVKLIGSITADIEGVTTAGQENSRAMEGISSSSEQQTASMEEVTTTANKLGTLADNLKTSLDMFQLQEKELVKEVKTITENN
ncbi:hypothetical protein LCGC14_0562590 [marine sediment metagenome]|uniref:Methyl-accepting chemotaxis protein n=1 Tax=marine sediment metagenome TaxID=412755 RepID=A0A0F9S591_9ZZZZ